MVQRTRSAHYSVILQCMHTVNRSTWHHIQSYINNRPGNNLRYSTSIEFTILRLANTSCGAKQPLAHISNSHAIIPFIPTQISLPPVPQPSWHVRSWMCSNRTTKVRQAAKQPLCQVSISTHITQLDNIEWNLHQHS